MAKNKERSSFVMYYDWEWLFTEENAWEMIQAIFDFQVRGIEPDPKDKTTRPLKAMLPQMKRDIEAYRETCARNKENIEKRWANERAKKEQAEKEHEELVKLKKAQ